MERESQLQELIHSAEKTHPHKQMKGVIESEGSSKHEDDSVAGWGELSVCHFRGEFSCLGDSTRVSQGREGSGLPGCGLQGFSGG